MRRNLKDSNISIGEDLPKRVQEIIKVLCEQTREANKRIQIFFLDYV